MGDDRVSNALSIGANLAVLAGLIFVGIQVRDGRTAAEAQVADGVTDGFLELNLAAVADPGVACVVLVGLESPGDLTVLEAARFSALMRGLFNQYLRVHRAYRTGLLDQEYWEGAAAEAAWFMSTPGGKAYFQENWLPPSFLEAIAPIAGATGGPKGLAVGMKPPASCEQVQQPVSAD
jgi:hypothetical protein